MQRFGIIHKLSSLMVLCTFSLMLCPVDTPAEDFTVKIIINPNSRSVPAASDEVALTAQATGTDLTYTWSLQGPGSISGSDGVEVLYMPPATIVGSSEMAVVSVTVADKNGKTAKDSVTLGIGFPNEGMSKGTKIALGAGALVVAGGVAAIALGGEDESSDNGGDPFSGTFTRNYSGNTTQGDGYNAVDAFRLTQRGSSILGDLTVASTLIGCCTASFSVPVSGTANVLSAILSWGPGVASCQCPEWTYTIEREAVTAVNADLINNNTVLRFESGVEVIRRTLVRKLATDGELVDTEDSVLPLGNFFRE